MSEVGPIDEKWLAIAAELAEVFQCGRESTDFRQSLSGVKIWIGSSKTDAAIVSHAAALRAAYRTMGAHVLNGEPGEPPFDSEITSQRLSIADVILMIAATPSVSVQAIEVCNLAIGDLDSRVRSRETCHRMRANLKVLLPKEFDSGFIARLLEKRGATKIRKELKEFQSPESGELFRASLLEIFDHRLIIEQGERQRMAEFQPKIGVITALPIEFEAVKSFLKASRTDYTRKPVYTEYVHGAVHCAEGRGSHELVVVRCGAGTNKATNAARGLIEKYPTIDSLFMIGIAGGVPDLSDAVRHVRLGDIVICDENGVIQSDMVKIKSNDTEHRPPPRPPSSRWLIRARGITADKDENPHIWSHVDSVLAKLGKKRPQSGALRDSPWLEGRTAARHPLDPDRTKGRPRVHIGPIASSNAVVKSAKYRDQLKKRFKIMAFEMETSGIAEVAWQGHVEYMVVRGVSDYSNDDKNDAWHGYASAVAAAFALRLIETMPAN